MFERMLKATLRGGSGARLKSDGGKGVIGRVIGGIGVII